MLIKKGIEKSIPFNFHQKSDVFRFLLSYFNKPALTL